MKKTLKKYQGLDELGTEEQKCNDFSMEVATRMTLKLIPKKNRNASAKDLLFFLGCLPGGISMNRLQKMWDQTLKEELKELQELSLIEVDSQ